MDSDTLTIRNIIPKITTSYWLHANVKFRFLTRLRACVQATLDVAAKSQQWLHGEIIWIYFGSFVS